MPARALIVAIEHYPNIVDFERVLPGTHDSAKTFLTWVKASKKFEKIPPADEPTRILVCSDDAAFPGRTHGANAQNIRDALGDLWKHGQDRTEELFVFISGHGFLFKESESVRPADVLVAADFGQTALSGAFCLKLDAIQLELRTALGAGNHYYFVDACRNLVSDQDIEVGALGVRLKRSSQSDAQVFTLFSTTRLSITPAASPFAAHLVEGLVGKGRAKQAVGGLPPRQRVVWARLLEYMKTRMAGVDAPAGGSNPGILWDEPLTNKVCVITIDNASAADTFTVAPKDAFLRPLATFDITGPRGEWPQPPDDYWLEVDHPMNAVSPIDPPARQPVDLYEDATARFVMEALDFAAPPAGGAGSSGAVSDVTPIPETVLTVVAPQGSTITVRNPATGEERKGGHHFSEAVRPNSPCVVEVFDREHTLIERREVTPALGEPTNVDVRFPDTQLRRAIASRFPSSPDSGVDFSESLNGRVTDPDLGVWLSIMAASRVLGPDRFDKLGPLPLQTFDDIAPGASAFYVLAGFDGDSRSLRVGLGRSADDHRWLTPDRPDVFPCLFELKTPVEPGGLLVSFAMNDGAPQTISSYALPNRATVMSVTGNARRLSIHQLLLPIHSLDRHLDPTILGRLPRNPLRAVKFVSQAQRLLERRRSVTESSAPGQEWREALEGKWLDPMMGIVASYELIRQGRIQDLGLAVTNLTAFFGDLPDTIALRKMMRPEDPIPPPSWPPMVTDGFTAFPDLTFDALPQSKLDFSGLWTTWRNAVPKDGR